MRYFVAKLKTTGKYDKRTRQNPSDYMTLLIADSQTPTEAYIKNRAREHLDSDMWVDTVIYVNEISESEFNKRAGMWGGVRA